MYVPIRGDVNYDGIVDQLDLNVISANFVTGTTPAQGDLNVDGIVDQLDLNEISASFINGVGSPPAAGLGSVVPEPSTLGLAALGLAGMIRRRSRR